VTKQVLLKKHEDNRIRAGHLWAFSNEIQDVVGHPQPGDVVTLRNAAGDALGQGLYNPNSLIAVRLLTRREDEPIDEQFFHRRIESALTLRRMLYDGEATFRLVHGESDFLPGLIIDKYGPYCSIQTLSYGMDQRLPMITEILESMLQPSGIVERNDTAIRSLEGLPSRRGILRGRVEPVVVSEHGIRYRVDLLDGQKTGLFLDQRENRWAIRRYARNGRMLDCFCNDGGFALHAATATASEVIGVDVSEPSVRRAIHNAELNELAGTTRFVTKDAFEFLDDAGTREEKFDVINLDPPSFAKSRKMVTRAKRGYRDLHRLALRVLAPGGILATSSCSYHIFEQTFLDIINETAQSLGKQLTLLQWSGAAPDHPVLPGMPETKYLKFGVFRVD
jgi:23S rRNA (cytosine1962-C5)-methyltransferase